MLLFRDTKKKSSSLCIRPTNRLTQQATTPFSRSYANANVYAQRVLMQNYIRHNHSRQT